MSTQKLIFNISANLKNKILQEVLDKRKEKQRRYTQTDFIIDILEMYFDKHPESVKTEPK